MAIGSSRTRIPMARRNEITHDPVGSSPVGGAGAAARTVARIGDGSPGQAAPALASSMRAAVAAGRNTHATSKGLGKMALSRVTAAQGDFAKIEL